VSLATGKAGVQVAEVGPNAFGLENLSIEDRQKEYTKRWTLRCDPHANGAQHELFASTAMGILEALRLVTR
jgi:hypothetical protein